MRLVVVVGDEYTGGVGCTGVVVVDGISDDPTIKTIVRRIINSVFITSEVRQKR